MKHEISIGIFAAVVVLLVAIIVFASGNNPVSLQNSGTNNPPTNPQNNLQNPESTDLQDQSTISRTELSAHNKQSGCWIAYEGKVYDITDWLPKHPGSASAIAPYCGTYEEFVNAFSGQHGTSQVGKLMREGIYKGDLE